MSIGADVRSRAQPSPVRTVARTDRLTLRWLHAGDAPFILELVNDPSWLRFIGNKGVHTLADAERYIENGPAASCARYGFGLNCVQLNATSAPIGICGLIKRDALPEVDLGFAFLPAFRGKGYAREAAEAALRHAADELGIARVLAIVSPDNAASTRLLASLGFGPEGVLPLHDEGKVLDVYAVRIGRS